MKIWVVAIHQQLTGDSSVELFASREQALARWNSHWESDQVEIESDGDNWQEDVDDNDYKWYWYDTGDSSCTVTFGWQDVPMGGTNE
jgi:hypothetical protein